MARTVAIGHQDYETVRMNDYFYIDKTDFIRVWWNSGDMVTLINPPETVRKDPQYEYDRKVLFCSLCRAAGSFRGDEGVGAGRFASSAGGRIR